MQTTPLTDYKIVHYNNDALELSLQRIQVMGPAISQYESVFGFTKSFFCQNPISLLLSHHPVQFDIGPVE